MSEETQLRLRDCPKIREQVLRVWFPMIEGCTLKDYELDWVNAGPLTVDEHNEKLAKILLHCKGPAQFLSFLDGWEACLMNQQIEMKGKR